jgi:tryptophan-rich sensory protein
VSREFSFGRLLASLGLCHLVSLGSLLFAIPSLAGWYGQLVKPGFAPPQWLFPPAWLSLYTLMGIALYAIWNQGAGRLEVKKTLLLFTMQLILNLLCASSFFGLHSLLLAAFLSLLLCLVLLLTILRAAKLSQAALLLLPHLLWSVYLAAVAWTLLFLN